MTRVVSARGPIAAFSAGGDEAIVAGDVPNYAPLAGCRRVRKSNYYAKILDSLVLHELYELPGR